VGWPEGTLDGFDDGCRDGWLVGPRITCVGARVALYLTGACVGARDGACVCIGACDGACVVTLARVGE